MNLFVFGLGYSARQFIGRYRDRFAEIAGTVRSPEKAQEIAAEGIEAYRFDATDHDPRILVQPRACRCTSDLDPAGR